MRVATRGPMDESPDASGSGNSLIPLSRIYSGALHRLLMTGGGVVATAVARGTRCRALGSLPCPWIVRRVGVARRVLGQPGDRGRQPMPGPRRQECAAAGICTKVPAPECRLGDGLQRSPIQNAAASYERDVSTVQRAPGRECPRTRRQLEASRVPKVPLSPARPSESALAWGSVLRTCHRRSQGQTSTGAQRRQ